ncbi:DNA repair protein RecN [Ahrensia sp. R2A130]|uniref:DNA repair protein RecN n=1 Tax=Ahrensia sp. R2A130 TaxID=744979 RepID=UPI0001E0C9C1|nr:DNA repair protein RecN [Ahrensia sp. R2A130]EFL90834.1 DNA repair protein RecN [Ahrensia sp. R2A130]
MLAALSIRDIVLIRALDVDFGAGLAVLSGETGAGKSILLDSLSLALGARGDGDLVRVGATQGQVSAVFDVPADHGIFDTLEEHDLVGDSRSEGVILRRTQNADGRTRAWINDRPVSVTQLRAIGRHLVEIHGQHEERAMVDPAAHRDLVDAFGGLEGQVTEVRAAHVDWRDKLRELNVLKARVEKAARDADYLRASVEELNELSPKEGEEEELAGRRQTMMSAEKIATDINEAYEVLAGQASPMPTLVNAMRKLERKADAAPGLLDTAIEAFGVAIDGLSAAEDSLQHALRLSEFDPRELESAEERLFALRAASRKYNVPVEGLASHSAQLSQDLADLDAGEGRLTELEAAATGAHNTVKTLALDLSAARQAAGERLSGRVMEELPALKLDQARFFVAQTVDAYEITADGCDTIEFHVQTNPGTRPGAMMKVASGGELSRFLLALKVALADRGSAPTLVFDEIDTGVGGAVADAIGGRLAQLAEHVQVLSVTHAPQVAARAVAHLLISKAKSEGSGDAVETKVEPIDGDARLEEIARMLSGAEVTDEARAAAARLLAS